MTAPVTYLYLHVVWSTRRRRQILDASVDARLIGLLGAKATALACTVVAAGCARDHVHVLLKLPSHQDVGTLVGRLKGASSYVLNRLPGGLDGVGWQSGYWAESVDPDALEAVARYVREQRAKHESRRVQEPWERLSQRRAPPAPKPPRAPKRPHGEA